MRVGSETIAYFAHVLLNALHHGRAWRLCREITCRQFVADANLPLIREPRQMHRCARDVAFHLGCRVEYGVGADRIVAPGALRQMRTLSAEDIGVSKTSTPIFVSYASRRIVSRYFP